MTTVEYIKLHEALSDEFYYIDDLLRQELAEDAEALVARQNNYRFLLHMLQQPDLHAREYEKIIFEKYGAVMGSDITNQLHANNVYSVGRRIRLERIMQEISLSTYNLLLGTSLDPYQDFDTVAKIVRARAFWSRRIEGKSFLITLITLPVWEKTSLNKSLSNVYNILDTVAQNGSYKLCRETARRLVDVLGVEYGFEKKKTSTERVQEILEDVETTRDIDDIRSTLLIVQRESKRLKEEFDREVDGHIQEFKRDFFTKMNSAKYSNLLDVVAQTEALIKELNDSQSDTKPELKTIQLVIQVFTNLLQSHGVQPIETVGNEKELSKAEFTNYEFIGSVNVSEKIRVIIRTPGWMFNDSLISKPRVEKIKPSTHSRRSL